MCSEVFLFIDSLTRDIRIIAEFLEGGSISPRQCCTGGIYLFEVSFDAESVVLAKPLEIMCTLKSSHLTPRVMISHMDTCLVYICRPHKGI